MRVPLDDGLALADFATTFDADDSAVGDLELVDLATTVIKEADGTISLQGDQVFVPILIVDLDFVAVFKRDGAGGWRGPARFDQGPRRGTAGVERTHGELCSWLADGLGSNDPNGHPDFPRTVRWTCPCRSSLHRHHVACGR